MFLESLVSDMLFFKLSLLAIQRSVSVKAGTMEDVKKLRSGQFLVEC